MALLPTIEQRRMYRASLVLNKQANDISRVLDCYIRDEDAAFRSVVFDFIDEVVARERAAGRRRDGSDSESEDEFTTPTMDKLRRAILQRFSDLTKINKEKVWHGGTPRLLAVAADTS